MGDTLGRTPGHWDSGKQPIAGIQEARQGLLGSRWVCEGSEAAGNWTPGNEGCLGGVGMGGDPGTEPQLGRCGAKAKGTGNKCISNIWDQKRRW